MKHPGANKYLHDLPHHHEGTDTDIEYCCTVSFGSEHESVI